MRRIALTLLLPLALAACEPPTPREACLNAARGDTRTLDRLIAETQGNIARGYALEERQEIRTRPSTCTGTNPDGTTFTFRCDETYTFTRRVPVAIDLNAARGTLASLTERRAAEMQRSEAAIAACLRQYPE